MERYPTVCFIHTPCPDLRDDRLEPPLGLLYLVSTLNLKGFSAQIVDLSACCDKDLTKQVPEGFDLYGFSTYTANYALTRELARSVRKQNPHALLLAGGPHATALPEGVVEDGFDTVVTGEGEMAMVQILEWVISGHSLPQILPGMPPDPLDQLPFPDYGLIDLSSYHRQVEGHPSISILSSRGCPFRCSFCNSNIMGAGKRIRFRSPENVVEEIRQLKRRYGVRHFRFQDDIFTINRKRLALLSPLLAAEDIVYRCFARVSNFSLEVAQMLALSGCRHVSFGVESGSPKLLGRHAMDKDQTPEHIRQALENAHKAGLVSRIYLMVGFPGETDGTVAETITLMRDCPWHEFAVYPLIAYPGTPLHDNPEAFGIINIDRSYSDYLQIGRDYKAGFTVRTAEFDEQQVREWRDHMMQALITDGRIWAGDSPNYK